MKRRILSIITALALCLSLCPTWAWAAAASPFYSTVYIGGTTVTDEASTTAINAGTGTAVWDPVSATLTLENATFSDYILIHTFDTTQTVKVILKGENKIDISSSNILDVFCALAANCTLEIEAEGNAALDITTNFDSNDSYGQNAIFTTGTLRIKSGTLNLRSAWQTIYGVAAVDIQGGSITAESSGVAIYSDNNIQIGEGAIVTAKSTGSNGVYTPRSIQITNSELNATGYYPAICGIEAIDIQGGSITATSTGSSAIYSDSSIQITDAEVTARGYGCAIFTPGTVNISESTVTGHSEANHVIYTTAPITIENSELTLTSDEYTSGIFLNANSPLVISECTNVNVTTAGSAIVSNGDVSIIDSRLTISSDAGNGIIAAVEEDNGGGTLSISGTTHIESQSAYPLTGFKVEMTGGYVKSVTYGGPAISATCGITVIGGEVYAESQGRYSQQPAGLYSRKGEINLTGEDTKVHAVSASYSAIYNEEGTINLNANVIAEAGAYESAFMACSVTNNASAGPTHNITIGEGFSSEGNRPVTTKWKNETLITGYSHYAYTVLAPAGTENLQDDYLDTPSQIMIAACLHPENQCAYAHTAGTTTHVRTCLGCGKVWTAENCSFGESGECVCGAELAVTLPADLALTYTGAAQEPAITVTVDRQTLTVENNYTVTYDNNINAGDTAKAIVTGTASFRTAQVSLMQS